MLNGETILSVKANYILRGSFTRNNRRSPQDCLLGRLRHPARRFLGMAHVRLEPRLNAAKCCTIATFMGCDSLDGL
jgi:hypothetical protein